MKFKSVGWSFFLAAIAASVAFLLISAFTSIQRPVKITPEAKLIADQMQPGRPINPNLLLLVRKHLLSRQVDPDNEQKIKSFYLLSDFPNSVWGMALTVYQPGQNRIIIVRRGNEGQEVFFELLKRLTKHKRFSKFDFSDPNKARLQFDFIIEKPEKINLFDYRMDILGPNRFEFGIHGLRMSYDNRTKYFLPGDAYTKSVLGLSQLARMIRVLTKKENLGSIQYEIFKSTSYVTYKNTFIQLYRGHPLVPALSRKMLRDAVDAGTKHLLTYQSSNGRFDYYYDAAHDSKIDHEHLKRDPKKNRYYNILRHSGAALSLVMHYNRYKDKESKLGAESAAKYLLKHSKHYRLKDNSEAAYIYYNKKSKLGGSGLALFFLTEYQRVTGDSQFENFSRQLMRHLLSQITDSGEFIYYNLYLDKPITTEEDNAKHFSFYYPGEAVCGIVNYYRYLANEEEKIAIRPLLKKSLHFLFEVRPKTRSQYYQSLPSDSWLMMAVSRLWDNPELRDPSYLEWVYRDADMMCQLTYKINDALYPDYIGAYYYTYGDFPFSDGARSEGLMAALELAIKTKNKEKIAAYGDTLKQAAWAEYFLVNTPESVYFAPNPEKSIGGIRFKHTRQWFRIDTIAHVTSFYMRLLDVLR